MEGWRDGLEDGGVPLDTSPQFGLSSGVDGDTTASGTSEASDSPPGAKPLGSTGAPTSPSPLPPPAPSAGPPKDAKFAKPPTSPPALPVLSKSAKAANSFPEAMAAAAEACRASRAGVSLRCGCEKSSSACAWIGAVARVTAGRVVSDPMSLSGSFETEKEHKNLQKNDQSTHRFPRPRRRRRHHRRRWVWCHPFAGAE